ncbi:asparagine synthase (glutamine-hydrolyzing) [Kitasatospora sp. NPDC097643]|uniref:asparagine synthase (glutamine-hydrolyzing) n=1 Tax=Kitasatospora sp. NPDC097643 TaxID=3157230 RepID=UPI00332C3177
MSGIAGWVDYTRDLTSWLPTVRTMAAALAHRGPDAENLWADRHVALANRTLAVDGVPTREPATAVDANGAPLAVITFAGLLTNAGPLGAELAARGHRPAGDSHSQLALHAYLEWGAAFVERLEGVFAFGLWDVRSEQLWLGRDRLGFTPLYYAPVDGGVLFGSEAKAILASGAVEPVVDAEGLSEILTYAGSPEHAIYKGIRKVRAGTLVRVDRDGHSTRQYWRMEYREHTDDLDTTIATVRELLAESVRAQAGGQQPVSSMLSGGLDSSAMVGMIGHTDPAAAQHTYTVTFTDYDEEFKPDVIRSTPDTGFVRDVADLVGARHANIVLDTAELMDPVVRLASLRARDLPSTYGDMNTSLYLLSRAVRERTRVVLSGETADSVFGGNVFSDDPEAKDEPLPWVALARRHGARHALGCGLLSDELLVGLDVDRYAVDRCQDARDELELPDSMPNSERRARQYTYLQLTRWAENQLAHSERMAAAVGLQLRMPYADTRLIDYVFNVPNAMKTFDGREKSLLRAATADLLPESVVKRRKSPFPIAIDPAYQQAVVEELRQAVDDRESLVAPLLDRSAVRKLLDQPGGPAENWITRTDVETVLSLDAWLRHYGVRIEL